MRDRLGFIDWMMASRPSGMFTVCAPVSLRTISSGSTRSGKANFQARAGSGVAVMTGVGVRVGSRVGAGVAVAVGVGVRDFWPRLGRVAAAWEIGSGVVVAVGVGVRCLRRRRS